MNKKNIIIYSIFAFVFIACFVFYSILSKDKKYSKITYNIDYPSDTLFIEKEFSEFVHKIHPAIIDKSIDSINLSILEKKIKTYPYISNADVMNNRGNLLIKARQERIIAKIFNNKDEQFYLAESEKLVPKSRNSAGRTIIVNGNIDKRYSNNCLVCQKDTVSKNNSKTLCIVWKIVRFIENDPFWKVQISQIYVNNKQEIELIPAIGDHIILFGNVASANNIDEAIKQRFKNLKNIYIEGFKIRGWDKYNSVNLKFGTEIPCEKKNKE
jgi:cell division protein FtsQ